MWLKRIGRDRPIPDGVMGLFYFMAFLYLGEIYSSLFYVLAAGLWLGTVLSLWVKRDEWNWDLQEMFDDEED